METSLTFRNLILFQCWFDILGLYWMTSVEHSSTVKSALQLLVLGQIASASVTNVTLHLILESRVRVPAGFLETVQNLPYPGDASLTWT